MDSRQRLVLLLITDLLFALTSYSFLLVGEAFGRERLEGRAIEPYPGNARAFSTAACIRDQMNGEVDELQHLRPGNSA